jgi:NADPH:quinone reductase-like Zn-dependent oxidoreductase
MAFDLKESISTNFTSTIHSKPYPAISPIKPALNQSGKTVLITGGGTGIGRAIAHNFVLASAATVSTIQTMLIYDNTNFLGHHYWPSHL